MNNMMIISFYNFAILQQHKVPVLLHWHCVKPFTGIAVSEFVHFLITKECQFSKSTKLFTHCFHFLLVLIVAWFSTVEVTVNMFNTNIWPFFLHYMIAIC